MSDGFDVPDMSAAAVFQAGVGLVATFPGLPYQTWLRSCAVQCSRQGQVDIYYGTISPTAKIATNSFGLNNTFGPVNARPIPWNNPVIVVWRSGLITDTASAVLSRAGRIG